MGIAQGRGGWLLYLGMFCLLPILPLSGCIQKSEPGKTTIRFVTWKPNQPAVWDELISVFEAEHPDIRVVREVGPHSSTAFHDLLTQKLKNRSDEVDVFFMDVIWPPEFAAAGWAMPLDDLFPPSEREAFLDGPVLANTYQGKTYGVPLFIDSGMLYYRKDLLRKYGFSPPKTWGEMVAQAERIVSGENREGAGLYGFSGQFKQYEGLVCDVMEFILSNNGHIINPETGEIEIDRKPAVDAVRFVRDEIIGKAAPRGVLTYEEPESLTLFLEGRAVFHRNWPYAWEVSQNAERSSVRGKVGISALPHFPGGRSYSALGGWQLGIGAFSKNREAAWTLIRFLTGERMQKHLALRAGLAPTRKALYADADVLTAYPQFSEMKAVFLTTWPRPRSPLYPALSHILQRYFSTVISDRRSDPEAEARIAAAEMRKVLALIGQ